MCPHCLPGSSDRCDFRLLHAESEYSYVSSTPLLDYLGGVFMVFRGIGVETRIYFGSFRQVTCIRSKFFILVVCLLTLNSNNEQLFLSSLHGFEDALLHFVGNPPMKEILGLLGVNVVTTTVPEPSCFVVASHQPMLSLYDFQKLCSVLCAYRSFPSVRNVLCESLSPPPRRVCFCQGHRVQRTLM